MVVFLIPIIGILCIAYLIYVYFKGRHAERMSIIEKGLDATEIDLGGPSKWVILRAGMLMLGLGLGCAFGSAINFGDLGTLGAMLGLSLFSGGFALVLNFWIEHKWRK